MDQPVALVDARDLAGWLVDMAAQGQSGAVNTTGPNGMTTYGGLLGLCREVTGGHVEWVPVPEADMLAADVEPWQHLPMWLPAETARTAWDVDTSRARELGLPSRPLRESVMDTWEWQRAHDGPEVPPGRTLPGLPTDLEARLLGG
jgi:2'-hydroxyisoflavone reductase